ncbi:RidA family protein [Thermophilibacter provencensis]|uniref:Rid family detoxifying hydrolase n=1 Tax=Thermophilibacter provencensis TaxID=1852386 RepID=A0ABT7V325_9ACTN|nr:Rid family detoxifying hydrolase [Thermophilibacter provencensis]MDM8270997.1 Rid family detoxifying hydrolase [Thermophilibacter provencensis]HJA29293.1 Rid family detoxifying hydrolase [Candidatus Olsenella pullicola]
MKYSINAPDAPEAFGPYSQGTTAGRLVFASGQLPISSDDNRRLVPGGIVEQTERVIDIIETLLEEVGCSLADVAQTTVYLSSLDNMAAMNEVYARRFTTPAPARAVVGVNELPLGALIEMDCVACR